MDKVARNGIRIADLMDAEEFELRLRHLVKEKNQVITQVYGGEALDVEEILTQYLEYAEIIRKYVRDTSVILNDAIDENQKYCSKARRASCWTSTKARTRSLRLRILLPAVYVSAPV